MVVILGPLVVVFAVAAAMVLAMVRLSTARERARRRQAPQHVVHLGPTTYYLVDARGRQVGPPWSASAPGTIDRTP